MLLKASSVLLSSLEAVGFSESRTSSPVSTIVPETPSLVDFKISRAQVEVHRVPWWWVEVVSLSLHDQSTFATWESLSLSFTITFQIALFTIPFPYVTFPFPFQQIFINLHSYCLMMSIKISHSQVIKSFTKVLLSLLSNYFKVLPR